MVFEGHGGGPLGHVRPRHSLDCPHARCVYDTCTDVQHADFALTFEMVWDVEWGWRKEAGGSLYHAGVFEAPRNQRYSKYSSIELTRINHKKIVQLEYITMISLLYDCQQRLETTSSHTQLLQLFEYLSHCAVKFSSNGTLL